MLGYDDKRNYIRMQMDCDITYKLADSSEEHKGRCTWISGAGVSFIADHFIDHGKAMEISVAPSNAATPSITAFIEVIRTTKKNDDHYEIAATIKSIKGT